MLKAVVMFIAAHYESLQDKLAQLKDAREALDALREDHREKRRREMEELERQRQIQMAHKLEIMRQKKHVGVTLITHLSRMDFPIPINWTSPFPILGVLGPVFQFYQNFDRIFCKQTVETLIRRRVMRRLVWVCTVCLCPTKRALGLYGLTHIASFLWDTDKQCRTRSDTTECGI